MTLIGEDGREHAFNKPFSDTACGEHLTRIGQIIMMLPLPPAKLLDLGCGTGWTSIFFAKSGYAVTGQDISEDMITYAEKNKKRGNIKNIDFLISDYESIRFNEIYDCAVFYDSLHHAEDEKAALSAVYNALKPGGLCIATEPGKDHDKSPDAIQAITKYNVTEKAMPPKKIITLGRGIGYSSFLTFPQTSHINKLIYNTGHNITSNGIKNIIFKFSLLRLLAFNLIALHFKRNSGITLLIK